MAQATCDDIVGLGVMTMDDSPQRRPAHLGAHLRRSPLPGSYLPVPPDVAPETRSEQAFTFEFAPAAGGLGSAIYRIRA
jgi:hypothetical protein